MPTQCRQLVDNVYGYFTYPSDGSSISDSPHPCEPLSPATRLMDHSNAPEHHDVTTFQHHQHHHQHHHQQQHQHHLQQQQHQHQIHPIHSQLDLRTFIHHNNNNSRFTKTPKITRDIRKNIKVLKVYWNILRQLSTTED